MTPAEQQYVTALKHLVLALNKLSDAARALLISRDNDIDRVVFDEGILRDVIAANRTAVSNITRSLARLEAAEAEAAGDEEGDEPPMPASPPTAH